MSDAENIKRQLDEQTQPKPRPENALPVQRQGDRTQSQPKERPAPAQKPSNKKN